jgi:hypothetical protein
MLAEGKETYTEFALKHYDWERIEKTKGQIIENQVDYISDVFDTVTGEVRLLILNSCSTVFVNMSVSPKRLL